MARKLVDTKNELVKESANDAYDEYLILLQQRNRLLNKLKEKDERQLELERKEQGFSLYLNGANVDLHLSGHHRSRKTKTAGESSDRQVQEHGCHSGGRAITAPSKPTRKGWNKSPPDKIKIKTYSGEKVNVDVPEIYTGNYDEDFEVYQSYIEAQLDDEDRDESEEENPNEDSTDSDGADSVGSDEMDAKLTFTVQDLKVLRESLEHDSSIMKSIASAKEELSPTDSEDEDEDHKNSTGFGLEEIEEEIPELIRSSYVEEDISEELIDIEDEDEDEKEQRPVELIKDEIRKPDLVELAGAAPKNRPVSSSRRETADKLSPDIKLSQDLLTAIAEENKKLDEYRDKRQTKTAPSKKSEYLIPKPEERPQTVAGALSDDVILTITEKVRNLGGRQQQKLLKMLAELEEAEKSNITNDWDTKKDKNKTFLEIEKNERVKKSLDSNSEKNILSLHSDNNKELLFEKREVPSSISDLVIKQKNLKSPRLRKPTESMIKSFDTKNSLTDSRHYIEVLFVFKSNWGNEKYIGLTEIEFIDMEHKLISLQPQDVSLLTDHTCYTEMKNLINSKPKTTKERHMWKCEINKKAPVEIMFKVPVKDISVLSKIIFWNYNKSLQELNIGVKECCIYVGGEITWTGIIDKGCGNQIFDYSKIIPITEIPASISMDNTDRPATRTIDRSGENTKQLPEVKVSHQSWLDQTVENDTTSHVDNRLPDALDSIKISAKRPSSQNGKPVWLEDSGKVKDLSKDNVLFPEEFKVPTRPSSGRRSHVSSPDILEEPKKRRPTSGRRSQISTPDITDDENTKKELDDLFNLNVKPQRYGRRGTPNDDGPKRNLTVISPPSGRHSPLMINMPSKKEDNAIKSERTKFKEVMDLNLEQSFQSIDNFKFHHLGRITATLDEDDDLHSLLEPIRNTYTAQQENKDFEEHREEVEKEANDRKSSSETFELPTLPSGKELIINIKTTWGDRHYVGLNGIEVFSNTGELVPIKDIQANPSDINMLPEYEGDPRRVANLIDGCYLTRDDMHLWLTPYTKDGDHFVEMQFHKDIQVAMIRIWNYNKSRIHSTRGARFIEMALDGKLIFIGEIARASGVLSNEDPYGDTILFTTDEEILECVAANDFTYETEIDEDEDVLASSGDLTQRPKTADKADEPLERPFTCPKSREGSRESSRESAQGDIKEESDKQEQILYDESGFTQCTVMSIFFSATWGDLHYLGLNGLEVLGETFERIPLTIDMLEANPRDLNDLEEYDDDDRTLDKLINDGNVTMSDENMWMIPFNEDDTHLLKITFPQPTIVTGIRLWNYNKSLEDTFRGAKIIHVYLDDFEVSPENGFLLRKGPGHCHFDFAQDILFNVPDSSCEYPEFERHRKINLHKIVNEYETLIMPSGFVFQFKLFSSWGDPYYIGLNGIEVYDKQGKKIELTDNNVTAFPHSVNVLKGIEGDIRTPDKLIDGINDTHDGRHMWLAPTLPGQTNIVYIVFDEPITLSMIKLWNYSKTPARGVRQFGLLVDDLLVYSGVLPQCALYARAILPGLEVPIFHHTMLFTDNEEVALKERKHLLSSTMAVQEQRIKLTNDRSVLQSCQDDNRPKSNVDPAMRPMTSVTSVGKMRR